MASRATERSHTVASQIFDCDSTSIPPGTKASPGCRVDSKRKLPISRSWWLLTGAVVAALIVGAALGRFVLS